MGTVGVWSRPTVGAAVRLGLITGISGFLLVVLSTAVAVSTISATTAVVSRGVLVTILLILTTRAITVALHASTGERLLGPLVAGLALGYVVNLGWWGGHAYMAQLAIDQPVVRAAVDGVLWVAVGSLVAHWSTPRAPELSD